MVKSIFLICPIIPSFLFLFEGRVRRKGLTMSFGLRLQDSFAIVSQVLELQVCATMPGYFDLLLEINVQFSKRAYRAYLSHLKIYCTEYSSRRH